MRMCILFMIALIAIPAAQAQAFVLNGLDVQEGVCVLGDKGREDAGKLLQQR